MSEQPIDKKILEHALHGIEMKYYHELMSREGMSQPEADRVSSEFIESFKAAHYRKLNYGLPTEIIQIADMYMRSVWTYGFTTKRAHIFALLRVQVYKKGSESTGKSIEAAEEFFESEVTNASN